MRGVAKIAAGLVLALLAYIAVGGLMMAAAGPLPLRGEMVDIGGRRLHIICEGPRSKAPTILFESGAFGFSADWGAVQQKVVAQGMHACAYDRAGMGLSDPGPMPRDGLTIVADLEKLLAAVHEDGPFILVGHSMAGLRLQLYAARNPSKVVGLVLVDATTPAVTETASGQKFVTLFTRACSPPPSMPRLVFADPWREQVWATRSVCRSAASAEKRRAFANPSHNRTAAMEVEQWT